MKKIKKLIKETVVFNTSPGIKVPELLLNTLPAIANTGTSGITASVNDLITREQAAQAIRTTLNK